MAGTYVPGQSYTFTGADGRLYRATPNADVTYQQEQDVVNNPIYTPIAGSDTESSLSYATDYPTTQQQINAWPSGMVGEFGTYNVGGQGVYYTPDQLQQQALSYLMSNTKQTPQFNLPQVGSAIPGMENFPGFYAYLDELYKNEKDKKKSIELQNAENAKLAFQAQGQKVKQPFLDKIFNAPTEEQNRLEAFQRLGYNEPEMFQQKQAALAAVNATNTQLTNMRAQMDTQIAKETDRIAPSGVIDNRIAKIQRNFAPQINSLTAQQAIQTASLAQMNQLYSDVNASVEKYVQAKSQEKRDAYDYIKILDEQMSPYIGMLDERIQRAWNQQVTDSANALKKAESDASQIIQMTIDAANKGIQLIPTPNATVQDVANQYANLVGSQPLTSGSTVGSDTTGYTNVVRDQYGNVVRTQPIRGALVGVSGGVSDNSSIDTWANALSTGQVGIQNVPMNLRDAVMQRVSQSGGSVISPTFAGKAKEAITAFNTADQMLNKIETEANKVITAGSALGAAWQRVTGNVGAATKLNPDAAVYKDTVNAFLSQLTRASGERGVLTTQDVERIKNALPQFSDTKSIAERKLVNLRDLFSAIKEGATQTYTQPLNKVQSTSLTAEEQALRSAGYTPEQIQQIKNAK
jgi:Holliday junction resolvasome RuvABC DNA-binding subunit